LAAVLAFAHEERFVEAQCLNQTDALFVVVDQGLAVAKEGVVDGGPLVVAGDITAELVGDLLNTASALADLPDEPASGPVRDEVSRERDAGVDSAPRTHRELRVGTEESALVPDDPGWSAVHGQVHEGHRAAVLHPGHLPALGTAHHFASALEVNSYPFAVTSLEASDVHVEQVDEEFAHAGRVCFHGGSSNLSVLATNRFAEPPPFVRPSSRPRFHPQTPRISEVPLKPHVTHCNFDVISLKLDVTSNHLPWSA
jgi:hypothetical protein